MGYALRTKFRCLSLTKKYDGVIMAELKPVKQGGVNSAENERFWSHTPHGQCTLNYYRECPLEVGAYYYIDLVLEEGSSCPQDPQRLWKLESMSRYSDGGFEAFLSWYSLFGFKERVDGLSSGHIKLWLEAKAQDCIVAFESSNFKRWSVEVTFAEPDDHEP